MQTISIKRHFRLLAAATILIVPLLGIASTALAQHGTAGTVNDATPNMVRSDGGGTYVNFVDCATSDVAGGGFYQLRTVQNAGTCNGERSWWNFHPIALPYVPGSPYHRFLTLDFSVPINGAPASPGNLDGSNSGSTQQYAPVRFIFNDAFSHNRSSTAVHIYILRVNADGTTTQDTAWDIEYQLQAPIIVNADGSRTLALAPNSAHADVYRIILVGRRTQSVFVGTYDLPFSVTTN